MNKTMVAVWLLMALCGCATVMERQSSAEAEVKKGSPVVSVYPLNAEAYSHASLAVLPFRLPEGMDPKLAVRIALLYQDVLLGKAAFPLVKVVERPYGDFAEALQAGRQADVDLVLAGKVNYAREGTELGGARLDLSVRLLNVGTGATVWSISQAMDQPYDYPRSGMGERLLAVLNPPEIKRSVGAPALTNMLMQSAVDIADVVAGARYVRR